MFWSQRWLSVATQTLCVTEFSPVYRSGLIFGLISNQFRNFYASWNLIHAGVCDLKFTVKFQLTVSPAPLQQRQHPWQVMRWSPNPCSPVNVCVQCECLCEECKTVWLNWDVKYHRVGVITQLSVERRTGREAARVSLNCCCHSFPQNWEESEQKNDASRSGETFSRECDIWGSARRLKTQNTWSW